MLYISDKGMQYLIYVDESGSINNRGKDGTLFSISLCFISQKNMVKMKNWFKREIKNLKSELRIKNTVELKAHYLIKNGKKKILWNLINRIREKYVTDYSAYILNENINFKWLKNKNVTYNFMIKSALERIFEINQEINHQDSINIIIDNREIKTGSFNSLNEYLFTTFVLERQIISNVKCQFSDSKNHWGIQMADFISWANYDEARNKSNLRRKRKIY